MNCSILLYHDRFIHCFIKDVLGKKSWYVTFVYAYAYPKKEKQLSLWQDILNLKHNSSLPWLLMGDFNNICSLTEKAGGIQFPYPSMSRFN